MTPPRLSVALIAAALLLLGATSCGSDKASTEPGSGKAVAAPDGTYTTETGPNDESLSLEVKNRTITHLKGKVHGECDAITVNESVDGDVKIPIENGAVAYNNEANGATTSLTGAFSDGTFDGTFTYGRPGASCPTAPLSAHAKNSAP
jgi:hypothetical protein